MLEVIKDILTSDYGIIVMSAVILALTELFKAPFKKAIKRLSERKQAIVNIVWVILPFGLGVLAQFLYCKYIIETPFTAKQIVTGINSLGSGAIALYELSIDKIKKWKKKKGEPEPVIDNPYETEEGQVIINAVNDVTADGVIDKKDIPTVQDTVQDLYKKIGKK